MIVGILPTRAVNAQHALSNLAVNALLWMLAVTATRAASSRKELLAEQLYLLVIWPKFVLAALPSAHSMSASSGAQLAHQVIRCHPRVMERFVLPASISNVPR